MLCNVPAIHPDMDQEKILSVLLKMLFYICLGYNKQTLPPAPGNHVAKNITATNCATPYGNTLPL